MTIYIVYKTTNRLDGSFYIGKHKTDHINDNYLGSGILLNRAIKKYGKQNFSREILKIFHTEEDAFNYERTIVTEELTSDPLCYNLSTGGMGGRKHHAETCKIMSEKAKGRTPWNKGRAIWSDEQKLQISYNSKNRPPQSEETRQKRIQSRKGYTHSKDTVKKIREKLLGRRYSAESLNKMSAAKKGKPNGRKGKPHPNRSSLCQSWTVTVDNNAVIVDDLKHWCAQHNVNYGLLHRYYKMNKAYKGIVLSKQDTT